MTAESPAPEHPTAAALDPDILTGAIRDVSGVKDLFAPAPTINQVPQLVSALATGQDERFSRVDVSTRNGTTTVTARIGVSNNVPATETARRVADTLLESVGDLSDAIITVQISRIA